MMGHIITENKKNNASNLVNLISYANKSKTNNYATSNAAYCNRWSQVSDAVCLSCSYTSQTWLIGAGSCLEWRLLGIHMTLYLTRNQFSTDSMWPSLNCFGHLFLTFPSFPSVPLGFSLHIEHAWTIYRILHIWTKSTSTVTVHS